MQINNKIQFKWELAELKEGKMKKDLEKEREEKKLIWILNRIKWITKETLHFLNYFNIFFCEA